MISVINYGVSNVGSMLNMLKRIGVEAVAISTADEVRRAEKIILPGVGAFDHGMKALCDLGLADALRERVTEHRTPLLGVCLGMQMLGRGSEEGQREGLALIEGVNQRFRTDGAERLRIPYMGWNEVSIEKPSPLFEGLERARFYFVHSYHFVCSDPGDRLATARYGSHFTAAVAHDNVWGVQFHPEKSHRFGMALLQNFAALA